VRAFAQRRLVDDEFVVLVGDADKFVGALDPAYGPVRVIPFPDLDLGSPTLGG
jgi:hypothetical protein